MPKLFANIEVHHQLGARMFTNLSYEGTSFLRMDFTQTRRLTEIWTGEGKIHWEELNWEQHPNQYSAINELARLPVKKYGGSRMARQLCPD